MSLSAADYAFKDEPIEIGIDEAGRGPVLGPMVYGLTFWPVSCSQQMKQQYQFADSKKLTEATRDSLFEEIKRMDKTQLGYLTDDLSPETISNDMMAETELGGRNLNRQSYDSAFGMLVKVLKSGFKVQTIICDQVGPPKTHERELRQFCGDYLDPSTVIICESKADDTYPVVSAASICAKVTRDQILRDWNFKEQEKAQDMENQEQRFGRVFGCGYPGDSLTKTWLRSSQDPVYGFPSIVRFSWGTSRKLIQVDGKDQIYWFDKIDEEKKNKPAAKGQSKLVVEQRSTLGARKIKSCFSTKLQLKRDAFSSL